MQLSFYNTLTRAKETFTPIRPGKVGLYSCGPTVYGFAHIGNLRCYLFADILYRTLRYNGFDVTAVMNITDVGHLTDDADAGEDKMIVAMRQEGKSAGEIAKFYTQAFFEDMDQVNNARFTVYPRATEHIAEQIALIQKMEANGYTYQTSDGVYFDTSKLSDYGKLSGQKSEEKKAGARVEQGEKHSPTDFALWKFSPAGTQREMEWESPWGKGFPGWHVECSAMSGKYLGIPFDIHTGGEDHIPVHHENELAQTQGANGVLEANVWMHNAFLQVNGGKMSKSLGNVYILQDLIDRGYDPIAFRYFCLSAQYRATLNFTFEALDAAQTALQKLYRIARDLPSHSDNVSVDTEVKFHEAINDDLNTPQALAVMWDMLASNLSFEQKSATLLKTDEILGLGLDRVIGKPVEISAEVQRLLDERQRARQEKNWALSDQLRDQIIHLGYEVEDTVDGQKIQKKSH